MNEKLGFNLFDHETDEEITDVAFSGLLAAPHVGDELHYWVDHIGTGEWDAPEIRRDFLVKRVVHDLRFMRRAGKSVHMVVLYVTEIDPDKGLRGEGPA